MTHLPSIFSLETDSEGLLRQHSTSAQRSIEEKVDFQHWTTNVSSTAPYQARLIDCITSVQHAEWCCRKLSEILQESMATPSLERSAILGKVIPDTKFRLDVGKVILLIWQYCLSQLTLLSCIPLSAKFAPDTSITRRRGAFRRPQPRNDKRSASVLNFLVPLHGICCSGSYCVQFRSTKRRPPDDRRHLSGHQAEQCCSWTTGRAGPLVVEHAGDFYLFGRLHVLGYVSSFRCMRSAYLSIERRGETSSHIGTPAGAVHTRAGLLYPRTASADTGDLSVGASQQREETSRQVCGDDLQPLFGSD